MNGRAQCLRRWDLAALILCGIFVLLTVGAVGEQGRKRAREVVCQANLHRWHDIFQGYIDPNGRFVSGDKGTPGFWWVKYLSEEHKDWKRTKIWFCPAASTPVMTADGHSVQRPMIFRAWGIYRGTGLGPNGISGSYGLNGYVILIAGGLYESGVSAKDGWQDLREVLNGNTVPMFVDALRYDLWPLPTDTAASNEFAAWSSNMMARCCINRHDAAVNCLFVDGSVRKVGLKELWTLKWHQSFNTAGPWTRGPAAHYPATGPSGSGHSRTTDPFARCGSQRSSSRSLSA